MGIYFVEVNYKNQHQSKTMNVKVLLYSGLAGLLTGCAMPGVNEDKTPVDYVNPYMGNVSHLLVPAFPNVHLPNSMLRVVPERSDFTSDKINGLPLIVTNHREKSAFNLSPFQGERNAVAPVIAYSYDNEDLRPYLYSVYLDEPEISVRFAPSHQSAVYELAMNPDAPAYIILNTRNGALRHEGNVISGYQNLDNNVKVYLYMESKQSPKEVFSVADGKNSNEVSGENAALALNYDNTEVLNIRYGISFISEEQAARNLRREIGNYDVDSVAGAARDIWNETLGKIEVETEDDRDKTLFYTSLYRTYERPVCLSEDGRYFSASDGKVHDDEGHPFYTDDWIWDTYRAAHPLRVISEPELELDIIHSYLRMAQQTDSLWMPTFPEITGDTRRMNSNHGVATVVDAYTKGLTGFDLELAYEACRRGIENKTLAPWSGKPAGKLDQFYKEHGYIPALAPGETETIPEVHPFEKRQPVAVTLGTSYDEWCLGRLAKLLGKEEEARYYDGRSYNYRNIFNAETKFFHPKDSEGKFIEPFDYRYPGGMGAREYYGENNGWVYRWDVPHHIPDLIKLMGGPQAFNNALDETFNEPLGKSKFEFYAQLPDHTGNVGQFSMANEPSLHVPYLYNYSGQPWKTQKRIRTLLRQWFRNDLMGLPGDEDGGGMSGFVAFSMLGFYPVTPGIPKYSIGSPMFEHAVIHLDNGKKFEIVASNTSDTNKYIQSVKLNGKTLDTPWFSHEDLRNGGKIEFVMGPKANREWGKNPDISSEFLAKSVSR